MLEKLQALEERYLELEGLISAPDAVNDLAAWQKNSKAHAKLTELIGKFREYKACQKTIDDTLELLGEKLDVEQYLRPPLYVPEGVTTTHLLENFRKSRQQCALIVDEYGELQGMVTLTDVLASIVGDVPSSDSAEMEDIVPRDDDSWLIDGSVTIERLKSVIDIDDEFPGEDENAYNTVGGLAMYILGRIPAVADTFEAAGFRFEVVDMDKNRVDKILLIRLNETRDGEDAGVEASA